MKKTREWIIFYIAYLERGGESKGHYLGNRSDGKRLDIRLALEQIKQESSSNLGAVVTDVIITNIWENK
jgi:hypothetical protein